MFVSCEENLGFGLANDSLVSITLLLPPLKLSCPVDELEIFSSFAFLLLLLEGGLCLQPDVSTSSLRVCLRSALPPSSFRRTWADHFCIIHPLLHLFRRPTFMPVSFHWTRREVWPHSFIFTFQTCCLVRFGVEWVMSCLDCPIYWPFWLVWLKSLRSQAVKVQGSSSFDPAFTE